MRTLPEPSALQGVRDAAEQGVTGGSFRAAVPDISITGLLAGHPLADPVVKTRANQGLDFSTTTPALIDDAGS
ncbi:MAG: hypothetical protein IT193_08500 [Propionibacteriaceae bacterium]|nr:hypothetical protein [Propionibacteriaceae bacterium]